MSSTRNTIHRIGAGETLDSLVADYRLSSTKAILDVESNASVRSKLLKDADLPIGLILHIPPNAEEILRRRMNKLSELKPVLLDHFDTLQELTITELMPVLAGHSYPFESEEVSSALHNFREFSLTAIDRVRANSIIFVELGEAMSLTHVARHDDRALGANSGDPVAGLRWAISEGGLNAWNTMWNRDVLDQKWNTGSSGDIARSLTDFQMTIRSIVVQSADRRFRESLILQQKLRAE